MHQFDSNHTHTTIELPHFSLSQFVLDSLYTLNDPDAQLFPFHFKNFVEYFFYKNLFFSVVFNSEVPVVEKEVEENDAPKVVEADEKAVENGHEEAAPTKNGDAEAAAPVEEEEEESKDGEEEAKNGDATGKGTDKIFFSSK